MQCAKVILQRKCNLNNRHYSYCYWTATSHLQIPFIVKVSTVFYASSYNVSVEAPTASILHARTHLYLHAFMLIGVNVAVIV
jgi:hypothetical protein